MGTCIRSEFISHSVSVCVSHPLPPLSQGTHNSLKGNSHALSTVTAIIDGTGSVGTQRMSLPSPRPAWRKQRMSRPLPSPPLPETCLGEGGKPLLLTSRDPRL